MCLKNDETSKLHSKAKKKQTLRPLHQWPHWGYTAKVLGNLKKEGTKPKPVKPYPLDNIGKTKKSGESKFNQI